jgi:hypothetical protein
LKTSRGSGTALRRISDLSSKSRIEKERRGIFKRGRPKEGKARVGAGRDTEEGQIRGNTLEKTAKITRQGMNDMIDKMKDSKNIKGKRYTLEGREENLSERKTEDRKTKGLNPLSGI